MNIKLIKLTLNNFKGIKKFVFEPNGNSLNVFGRNGAGKTSLFDAFMWLLFNKDSENKSTENMGIKEKDKKGNEKNNLSHEVEAVLLINGSKKELKKVYKEKWTKQRGKPIAEFTGHTTDYFIDGVPKKKKEYDEFINELIDEEVFKLVTNPMHFNNLHWKDRRNILFEVAGDVTDEEVLKSKADFKVLLDSLNGNSVEDHKKVIASKKREINKRLDVIPELINENELSISQDVDMSKEEIEKELSRNDEKIEQLESEIKASISSLELDLVKVENKHKQENLNEINEFELDLQNDKSKAEMLESALENDKENLDSVRYTLEFCAKEINEINERGVALKNKEYDGELVCPTCKQDLQEESIEEAKKHFNLDKSNKLQELREEGKRLISKKREQEDEIERLEIMIKNKEEELEHNKAVIQVNESKLNEMKGSIKPVEETEEYKEVLNKIEELKKEYNSILSNNQEKINELEDVMRVVKDEKEELNKKLMSIEQAEKTRERIAELEDEQKKLSVEFEKLMKQVYLIDEFTVTKVEMIEEKINSKFGLVKFKLFHKQTNGGIDETCVAMIDGVEYDRGLNNSAKINAGLDIINTLSDFYEVEAPIFVDNAESITDPIEVNSQMIRLVVSKNHKELTSELLGGSEKGAA